MSTTESENGTTAQYVPFTPFQESYAFESEPATLLEQYEAAPAVTPFLSEYAGVATQNPQAAELHDLLFELYDPEFDEVLAEIAHEAWEAVTERAAPFGETGTAESAERFLEEWSAPVRRDAETMLENVAQAVSEHDLASMSESEIDTFFERFEPRGTGLEPHFENFLGGLWNKAKNLAKKAIDVAKKGIALIPGLSGLIGKLKGLVWPLLNRVLKMAIDKLPPTLQPLARQLAQRVLGAQVKEADGEDFAATPAAPDVSAVQQQFDFEAAMLMFAADETEQEVVLGEAVYGMELEDGAPVAALHEARARFVDQLEAGVNPEQALEQFIPAVMAVLPIARTVIGVIGRKRVVNTLANFLAGYVGRYIPKESATQLSQAIVDAGLRLLSLEAPAESEARTPRLACETIAQTVEDTVRRVTELDESTFEDTARFEAALTDAFHGAAAENFPPQLILPELHEAPLRATWVAMPRRRKHKYYKKYTHVFDIEITPQVAESITTFGGTKLSAFLKDQLGVVAPVRARVHLYQAISGTTLRRIASCEKAVPGFGATAKTGVVQLHPLTVQAAGTLLQHPKLGRDIPGEFLSSRRMIAVGERFLLPRDRGCPPDHGDDGRRRGRGRPPNERRERHARLPEGRVPRLRLPQRVGRPGDRGQDPQAGPDLGAAAREAGVRSRTERRARRRHPASREDPHRGGSAGAALRQAAEAACAAREGAPDEEGRRLGRQGGFGLPEGGRGRVRRRDGGPGRRRHDHRAAREPSGRSARAQAAARRGDRHRRPRRSRVPVQGRAAIRGEDRTGVPF